MSSSPGKRLLAAGKLFNKSSANNNTLGIERALDIMYELHDGHNVACEKSMTKLSQDVRFTNNITTLLKRRSSRRREALMLQKLHSRAVDILMWFSSANCDRQLALGNAADGELIKVLVCKVSDPTADTNSIFYSCATLNNCFGRVTKLPNGSGLAGPRNAETAQLGKQAMIRVGLFLENVAGVRINSLEIERFSTRTDKQEWKNKTRIMLGNLLIAILIAHERLRINDGGLYKYHSQADVQVEQLLEQLTGLTRDINSRTSSNTNLCKIGQFIGSLFGIKVGCKEERECKTKGIELLYYFCHVLGDERGPIPWTAPIIETVLLTKCKDDRSCLYWWFAVIHDPTIHMQHHMTQMITTVERMIHAWLPHMSATFRSVRTVDKYDSEFAPVMMKKSAVKTKVECFASNCKNQSGISNQGMLKCGGCGEAWYCGPCCQKFHWKEAHKKECQKLKKSKKKSKQKSKSTAPGGGGGGYGGGAGNNAGPRTNTPLVLYTTSFSRKRTLKLPPASTRFPRCQGHRIRLLVATSDPPNFIVDPSWKVYHGKQGAKNFNQEGFKTGDIVLLWPGTYNSQTWSLSELRVTNKSHDTPSTIEILGLGRKNTVRIVNQDNQVVVVGGRNLAPDELFAVRLANISFVGNTYDSVVAVLGQSRRVYLEMELCTIHAGAILERASTTSKIDNCWCEDMSRTGGVGINVAQGVCCIKDCTIEYAAGFGLSVGFHSTAPRVDPTRKGSSVLIRGLKSRPELNGTIGISHGVHPNGRVILQLITGEKIKVKKSCISPTETDESSKTTHSGHETALPVVTLQGQGSGSSWPNWPSQHEIQHNLLRFCALGDQRITIRGSTGAIQIIDAGTSALISYNAIHKTGGPAVLKVDTSEEEELPEKDWKLMEQIIGKEEVQFFKWNDTVKQARDPNGGTIVMLANDFNDNGSGKGKGKNPDCVTREIPSDVLEKQSKIDAEHQKRMDSIREQKRLNQVEQGLDHPPGMELELGVRLVLHKFMRELDDWLEVFNVATETGDVMDGLILRGKQCMNETRDDGGETRLNENIVDYFTTFYSGIGSTSDGAIIQKMQNNLNHPGLNELVGRILACDAAFMSSPFSTKALHVSDHQLPILQLALNLMPNVKPGLVVVTASANLGNGLDDKYKKNYACLASHVVEQMYHAYGDFFKNFNMQAMNFIEEYQLEKNNLVFKLTESLLPKIGLHWRDNAVMVGIMVATMEL